MALVDNNFHERIVNKFEIKYRFEKSNLYLLKRLSSNEISYKKIYNKHIHNTLTNVFNLNLLFTIKLLQAKSSMQFYSKPESNSYLQALLKPFKKLEHDLRKAEKTGLTFNKILFSNKKNMINFITAAYNSDTNQVLHTYKNYQKYINPLKQEFIFPFHSKRMEKWKLKNTSFKIKSNFNTYFYKDLFSSNTISITDINPLKNSILKLNERPSSFAETKPDSPENIPTHEKNEKSNKPFLQYEFSNQNFKSVTNELKIRLEGKRNEIGNPGIFNSSTTLNRHIKRNKSVSYFIEKLEKKKILKAGNDFGSIGNRLLSKNTPDMTHIYNYQLTQMYHNNNNPLSHIVSNNRIPDTPGDPNNEKIQHTYLNENKKEIINFNQTMDSFPVKKTTKPISANELNRLTDNVYRLLEKRLKREFELRR